MTVFVVQRQMRFDPERRCLVNRFSGISKAERWGNLEFVLSPDANPFDGDTVAGAAHSRLFGFGDDDYLVLTGNPVLIGIVTTVAARYNDGRVKFLQWSGRHEDYTEVTYRIF